MTTTRYATMTAAVLSLLLAAAPGCGASETPGDPATSDIGTDSAAIDSSFLPRQFQVRWAPGIPGGVPEDDDPIRPATVWLPAGNPYGGYSVNPALTGQGNAAAFTGAMQAAINAAGAAATPSSRKIVLLKAGTYYVNPQSLPNKGGQVGLYVTVDNVTIRGEGADRTRLAANGTIPDYGTVVLFGHRGGFSDADFRVTAVTQQRLDEHQHHRGGEMPAASPWATSSPSTCWTVPATPGRQRAAERRLPLVLRRAVLQAATLLLLGGARHRARRGSNVSDLGERERGRGERRPPLALA